MVVSNVGVRGAAVATTQQRTTRAHVSAVTRCEYKRARTSKERAVFAHQTSVDVWVRTRTSQRHGQEASEEDGLKRRNDD